MWLQQQKFIFSQFSRLVLAWSGFGEGSLFLAYNHLPTVFSVDRERKDRKRRGEKLRAQIGISSYKGTNSIMRATLS